MYNPVFTNRDSDTHMEFTRQDWANERELSNWEKELVENDIEQAERDDTEQFNEQ